MYNKMNYTTRMFERCLYFNVNALARTVNRIWDGAFKELGLSPSHAYLLRLVLSEPGMTQKMIATELRLEKSTVTRFVDSLQARGLVKRAKTGTEDRREHGVYPTERGKRLESALGRTGEKLFQRMCREFGKSEIESFVRELREATRKLA